MLVTKRDFNNFLLLLSDGLGNFDNVIVPQAAENKTRFYLKKLKRDAKQEIYLNSYRSINPLKFFLYPVREKVYPVSEFIPRTVIVGVKACDLKALQILDKALLEGNFVEPSYSRLRENTVLISSDCDEISNTCHCNLVGGKPFPEEKFDLNLSSFDNQFKISIGSEKGKELIELMKKKIEWRDSTPEEEKIIVNNRKQIQNTLLEQNVEYTIRENYSKFRMVGEEIWKEESRNCVGCGACTNICPTCYCLILNDESKIKSDEFIKVRSYDSCQWCGYARVAGGGTPRPEVHQRFRNRYLCKFDYMHNNFGEIGCTGCGRCIEACTDFRKVVQKVSVKAEQIINN